MRRVPGLCGDLKKENPIHIQYRIIFYGNIHDGTMPGSYIYLYMGS
jgi:hypothetical protein